MKINRSLLAAVIIALAGVAWVGSGQFSDPGEGGKEEKDAATDTGTAAPGASSQAQPAAPAAAPRRVRVQTLTAETRTRVLSVNGRTAAARTLSLRAETAGRVEALLVPKGTVVKAGQSVLRLAADDRPQRLAEAEANVERRSLEYAQARDLQRKDYASRTTLAEKLAELETARAELAAIRLDVAHTTIAAPFAGVLNSTEVEIGDVVAVGGSVGALVELDPLLVAAEIAERNAEAVTVGSPAEIRLVDGRTAQGAVSWRSRTTTAATRTFSIEVKIANPGNAIPAGMTAEVRLPLDAVRAHRVSPAVLTLSDSGRVGVKLVEEGGKVSFHPVDMVADGPEGIWLAGLPDTARIIAVGAEYVREGEIVEAVEVDAAGQQTGEAVAR